MWLPEGVLPSYGEQFHVWSLLSDWRDLRNSPLSFQGVRILLAQHWRSNFFLESKSKRERRGKSWFNWNSAQHFLLELWAIYTLLWFRSSTAETWRYKQKMHCSPRYLEHYFVWLAHFVLRKDLSESRSRTIEFACKNAIKFVARTAPRVDLTGIGHFLSEMRPTTWNQRLRMAIVMS